MVSTSLRQAARGAAVGGIFTLSTFTLQQLNLVPFELFSWGTPIFILGSVGLVLAGFNKNVWTGAAVGSALSSLVLFLLGVTIFNLAESPAELQGVSRNLFSSGA